MSNSVESILHVALRGLNLRQQVTADNIANADTPGFQARVVRFEDRLQRAIQGGGGDMTTDQSVALRVENAPWGRGKADGNTVDLEQELLGMTDTSMRYNAVTRALSDRLALYRSVLTDGTG